MIRLLGCGSPSHDFLLYGVAFEHNLALEPSDAAASPWKVVGLG
jgi:hypothetical protein